MQLESLRGGVYRILDPLTNGLARRRVHPNLLTTVGFAVTILAAWSFHQHLMQLGGFLVLLGGFFDILDGRVARLTEGLLRLRGAGLRALVQPAEPAARHVGVQDDHAEVEQEERVRVVLRMRVRRAPDLSHERVTVARNAAFDVRVEPDLDVRGGRLSDALTMPLGGLRLIDASGGSLKIAREIVDAEFSKVDWLEKGRGRDFYAIGGTWRALARLHMTQTNYPLSVMHNYRINADEALRFAALLDHQSQSSLAGIRDLRLPLPARQLGVEHRGHERHRVMCLEVRRLVGEHGVGDAESEVGIAEAPREGHSGERAGAPDGGRGE